MKPKTSRNLFRTVLCSLVFLSAASFCRADRALKYGQPELLGEPCRAKQVLAGRVVTDRTDGRERFVLTNDNETKGLELLFIDFENDSGKMFIAPAGAGSWALKEVPGDRLAVGTFYDGTFIFFDLKKMEYIRTVKFPGEQYIWNLALGADGRIYGGTYPGARLGVVDLGTYAFEDCGGPAAPNLYLRTVSATPEGLIVCTFGTQEQKTLVFDPATKKFSPLPAGMEKVGAGYSWNGYFLSGAQSFRGKSFEKIDPVPFPVPSAAKEEWTVDPLTTNDVLFLRQGNAIYRHEKTGSLLQLVADIDLRGGWIMAAGRKGELLGIRGQDYFIIRPGDRELNLKPIPIEGRGRPALFLKVDPKGRLWGGPHFGQTLFWIDTATLKITNTGNVVDGGGEVYDVAFRDNLVYTASYAGGDITVFDPDSPWDQWNRKNPRPVVSVGPAYIRPTGGILTVNDKLYSGWMAKYGIYGGAVAITDPHSGKTDLIENPLGTQAVESLAVDDRFAYIGTSLTGNGLPDKKGEWPRFGMIDLASRKVIRQATFEKAQAVRPLVLDSKTHRVAMIVEGTLRVFDAVGRHFVTDLGISLPSITSHSIAAPGTGILYAGSNRNLLAINLKNGQWNVIGVMPAAVTNVTVTGDGTIYVSCEAEVYRLKPAR